MDNKNHVYIHKGSLFSCKKNVIYKTIDRTGDHGIKWKTSNSERQKSMWHANLNTMMGQETNLDSSN